MASWHVRYRDENLHISLVPSSLSCSSSHRCQPQGSYLLPFTSASNHEKRARLTCSWSSGEESFCGYPPFPIGSVLGSPRPAMSSAMSMSAGFGGGAASGAGMYGGTVGVDTEVSSAAASSAAGSHKPGGGPWRCIGGCVSKLGTKMDASARKPLLRSGEPDRGAAEPSRTSCKIGEGSASLDRARVIIRRCLSLHSSSIFDGSAEMPFTSMMRSPVLTAEAEFAP